MPVNIDILTQIRMRIASLTFPDLGFMRGKYVIISSKPINVLCPFSFQLLFVVVQLNLMFPWRDYAY